MPPSYRVDHIGSLMRTRELIEARSAITNATRHGREPTAEQKEKVDLLVQRDIEEVVKIQFERGITTITTGEFEREYFFDGFFESLAGTEKRFLGWDAYRPELPTNKPLISWGLPGREALVVTSKVQRAKSAYLDDWLMLRNLLPEDRWKDAKLTVPSPTFHHVALNEPYTAESGYGNDSDYLKDISLALREEMLELYAHGLRNIQVDDPNLSNFCSEEWMDVLKARGYDTSKWMDLYIAAHNTILRDLPADLNIGMHICRGNYKNGIFVVSGGYEEIAGRLFNETNYRLFYLEFDSPRAGDFGPLKHLPKDKAVVLGVVTTKSAEMEDPTELKQRILEASKVIADANDMSQEEALNSCIAVSPQCGFSSDHSGAGIGMSVDVQWKKLELLQNLADDVWPGRRSWSTAEH